MYEWRSDLGNDQAGDGARFHGRANYRDYGQKLGVDLEGKPDLALDSAIAARILADYCATRQIVAAANSNWEEVRIAVNGGLNGWDVFIDYVEPARLYYSPAIINNHPYYYFFCHT